MIRNSTNQISIKPKISSTARMAIIVVGLMLLAAALYFAHSRGVKSGHQQFDQDRALIAQLNKSINDSRSDLATAKEELVIAQRHQQIQEEAYKQVSSAYASSEQKNRYLGSRLDFYRSIISPEDGQSGPVIQSVQAAQQGQNVNFDITLVQAIKHKHQVRGSLRAELYDGDKMVAEWPSGNARSVNFQYFQQISGVMESINLVENARMRVQLTLQAGDVVETWFDIQGVDSVSSAAN